MRVRLQKEKQRELIKQFIKMHNLNLNEVSKMFSVSRTTVYYWYTEKNLLPLHIYKRLDGKNLFKSNILEFKEENWGKEKGGSVSPGNTLNIKKPVLDARLAELMGILFGDGNSYFRKERGIGVYAIRIVGHFKDDKDYLSKFVKDLVESLFGTIGKISYSKKSKAIVLSFYSRELVEELKKFGFPPGDKIKNKLEIPSWIKENRVFLKSFIRGLIDTDGSVFRMSNKDPGLIRISFTNLIPYLLVDTRDCLLQLGFNPSKIISNKQIFLSRKDNISLYREEIGFSNAKHIKRLRKFGLYSPVV